MKTILTVIAIFICSLVSANAAEQHQQHQQQVEHHAPAPVMQHQQVERRSPAPVMQHQQHQQQVEHHAPAPVMQHQHQQQVERRIESHGGDQHMLNHRGYENHRFGRDVHGWNEGRWHNQCFNGRCGWWWLVGGAWYFYDQPIYPYPVIVSPIIEGDIGAVEIQQVAPPMTSSQDIIPPSSDNVRYYCSSPPGFFPGIQTCNVQFQQIPQ